MYDVTPQTRAQILRDMLSGSDGGTSYKNVEVKGMKLFNDCIAFYPMTSNNVVLILCLLVNMNSYQKVVTGYIWRYAKTQNASLFFRGIRTWSADGPEERHLQILNSWGPLLLGPVWPLKTIFLEGDPRYRDVSSTVVRRICADRRQIRDDGEDTSRDDELSRLVPESVIEKVVQSYG